VDVLPSFAELRVADLFDIAIVAGLLWLALAWFQASRARVALVGLAAVAILFEVARQLDLQLTTWLLQGFFAVTALVLVVVFQDDLRRLFEGIAVWGLRRSAPRPAHDVERALVNVCFRLAQSKIGALIVLPGREPLERHLEGGVHLAGRLSESLLQSLFDTGTPGHDGAIIVRANNVLRFGVHLPLSTDWDRLGGGGTRHAAALGLAERCDALCLVVSEERGEVSVAHGGELEVVTGPEALAREISQFIDRTVRAPSQGGVHTLLSALRRGWREGLVALSVAAGLWYVTVPGAAVDEIERSVPVTVENLPSGYELVSVEPAKVDVRFKGRRRDFYLAGPADFALRVDALLVQLGRRTFTLSLDQVESPERLQAVALDPGKIRLSVKAR